VRLGFLDCAACDKCIPVCPNDANFAWETPARTVAFRDLLVVGGALAPGPERSLVLGGRSHQIANWADACNDCGNCDVFCPEDGGPHLEKPRLFSSLASFLAAAPGPGVFARRDADGSRTARARMGSSELELVLAPDGTAVFRDGAAELVFASVDASAPVSARLRMPAAPEGHVVDVGSYHALRALLDGVFAPAAVSWATATFPNPNEREISR
jgi:putative selenate reductase